MKLYNNTGEILLGILENVISATVEEERNGNFELIVSYPINDDLYLSLEKENIIVANANDTLKDQKFVIYKVSNYMQNQITVYARHISFDLAHDILENEVSFENQSCEYALNEIFRNSISSKHYRGFSNIVNAQKFKVSKINCLSAIAGTKGSVIDTFGTGAEILRDNTNIHVLTRRGRDNDVSIEYRKNLTGLKADEDTSELVTRIKAYATQRSSEGNETIVTYKGYIDAPNINKFSKPFSKWVDYSDKFEQGEEITEEKLKIYAERDYTVNKVHIPKCNYKLEFIPLSKVVGYEGLEDKISLCDTVTIKDTRYNINTKVKVIKTVYNVLLDRYDSIELGEPRTTLGNIISGITSSNTSSSTNKPDGSGKDDVIIDLDKFPNTLPAAPVLTGECVGFQSVSLSWTYENKLYYTYELYASKTKDFTPNSFDLIFEGQASAFTHEVNPSETWYYKACAKNTYGNRTEFSKQIAITTTKIEDFDQYFSSLAVKNLVANIFSVDHMRAGTIKGDWIDAKNLTVTDGNGKRTFQVDSFGNLYGDFTTFKINSKDVATQEWAKQEISPGYILHSINTSIQNEGTSISTISTLLNKNGFSVYNGAINVFNKNNEKVFWVDPTGRASVSNLNIYGEERLGNIDIKGTGNKGIVIRSLNGGDRYIDFSTYNDDGSNWEEEIKQGNFTRLWAMNGDFYIMPTDKLFISSCNSKFGGSKLDEVIIKARKTTIEGNVEADWLKAISGIETPALTVNNIYSGGGWLIFNSKANFKNQIYCEDYLLTKKIGYGSNGGVLNKNEPITFYSPIELNNKNIGGVGTVSTTNLSANNAELNYAKINHLNGDLNCNNKQLYNLKYISGENLSGSKVTCNEISGGSYFRILSSPDFNRNSINNVYRVSCTELAVSGSKNCVQDTENFGKRLINAYETCDYLFGDAGESIIENGECIVYLDDIFKEIITTDITYQVFLTKYGKGDIWVSERHEDYFIVQADNDISFGWEIKAKRKGYENYRLVEYKEESEIKQDE